MTRGLSWFLLLLWAAWLFSLQGWWGGHPGLSAWTPELGVVLLLVLDPRLERSDALLALALVSAGALATSSDPPAALLAGYAAVVFTARRMRSVVEIDRPLGRALLAGCCAACLTVLLALARAAELALDVPSAAGLSAGAGRAAIATALASLLLAPLLPRLPGMSPLRGRSR